MTSPFFILRWLVIRNFIVLFLACMSIKSLSTSCSNTMHILLQSSYDDGCAHQQSQNIAWLYKHSYYCRVMCKVLDTLVDNSCVKFTVQEFSHLLIFLASIWRTRVLETLTISQLVYKFPFYGSQRFISMHLSLSSGRIHSTLIHPVSLNPFWHYLPSASRPSGGLDLTSPYISQSKFLDYCHQYLTMVHISFILSQYFFSSWW